MGLARTWFMLSIVCCRHVCSFWLTTSICWPCYSTLHVCCYSQLAMSVCWLCYCTHHVCCYSRLTTNIYWPCYCCYSFFARLCNLIKWNRIRVSFIVCFIPVLPLEIQYQDGSVRIPLTPLHVCACPKPRHGFPTIYVAVFFRVQ